MTTARPTAAGAPALGAALYAVVEEYAGLGEHRTGTDVDAATVAWFAEHLRGRGAAVEERPYTFPRYDARWEVRVDGEAVEALPLFYEGVGRVRTTEPAVAALEPAPASGDVQAFVGWAEVARTAARADALVVATLGPTGLLTALNRAPATPAGTPAVCVPGALAGRLTAGAVSVDLEARVVEGRSANVVARFGAGPPEETITVATPLSGWFRCAGERGTGIAVAAHVAEQLAATRPVRLLASTGHELSHLGAHALLGSIDAPSRAVVHVGASVAATAGDARHAEGAVPTPHLLVAAAADAGRLEGVRAAMAAIGRDVHVPARPDDAASWRGEARRWAGRGAPLLSMAGGFPLFHTPQDVPERSTTPDLLAAVAGALTAATAALAG